jgi:hypothetical protein
MAGQNFQKILDKQVTRREFLMLVGLGVATLSGIMGLIKLLEAQAATPGTSIEPEDGILSGGATVLTNAAASGGKAVKFSSGTTGGPISDATLNALIAAVPPSTASPAPTGPVAGQAGQFDTSTLATNEIWDNFNGTTLDSRLWQFDSINQGGTQTYQAENLTLDGNGHAVMTCTRPASTIYSGRFTSRQKFAMKYGWCASSLKMPLSKNGVGGAWFPAFWMLLVGYNTSPNYCEIDIMEQFGDSTTYSTHLYSNDNTATDNKESYVDVPASQSSDASQAYHTYWMLWEADRIRIGVDQVRMGDWKSTDFSAGTWAAHFQQPMYYIFNFAAAPSWLPAPKASDFPAQMLVDWAWYKPLSTIS